MKRIIFGTLYNANKEYEWTKMWAGQLREFLPDETIIAIDHNHTKEEIKICEESGITVLPRKTNHSFSRAHGAAFDSAAEWCRENNIDVMVHIEPDVAIYGREWFDNLMNGIEEGFWVSGIFRRAYADVLHGCVSAWSLKHCEHSFKDCRKGKDVHQKFYQSTVNEIQMANTYKKLTYMRWNLYNWDVGDKNWFEAAKLGKYTKVLGPDCSHKHIGSFRGPFEVPVEQVDHRFENLREKYTIKFM